MLNNNFFILKFFFVCLFLFLFFDYINYFNYIYFYNYIEIIKNYFYYTFNNISYYSESNLYYNKSLYIKISEIFRDIHSYILLHNLLSYFFIFLICLFSTFLIINKNPMLSVICLILVYFSSSFFLVFLEVHFLAVIIILVYLGAVVVLFLFVIMMLNIKIQEKTKNLTFFPFLIIFVCILFFNYSKFSISFSKQDHPVSLYIYDNFSLALGLELERKTNNIFLHGIENYKLTSVENTLVKNFKIQEFKFIDINNKTTYNYNYFLCTYLDSLLIQEQNLFIKANSMFDQGIILNKIKDKEVFLITMNYSLENFKILAFILYTDFFLDLIISAFVLLVAMLGCISLTLTSDSSVLKKQDSMVQILHKNSIILKKKK